MKRIRNAIAFCMVLLLLLVFAGCAEPTPSSSVPPSSSSSSGQSSQPDLEIQHTEASSLTIPMDGGMSYEEYYSIERDLKPCQEISSEQGRQYNTPYGTLIVSEHEISLNRYFTTVLYRDSAQITNCTVDEDWIIWMEQKENRAATICRIYLPTRHFERIYSSDGLRWYTCLSSTDIRLFEGHYYQIDGKMQLAATIYSQLTKRLYFVEFQNDNEGLIDLYRDQRDQDLAGQGNMEENKPASIGTADLIVGSKNPALYREYLWQEKAEYKTPDIDDWRAVGCKLYENGTGKLLFEFRSDIRTAFITEEAIYFISGALLYRYHPASQTIDLLCREVGDCDRIRPITNWITELYMPNPRYGAEGEEKMIYRYVDYRSAYSEPIPMNASIEDRIRKFEKPAH